MTRRSRACLGIPQAPPGARALAAGKAALAGALLLVPAAEAAEAVKAAPAGAARAAIAEPPAAYRGAALPLQARDTASLLARAEEHIDAGDWARGFSALDEVLSRVTAPRGSRRARARPAGGDGAGASAVDDGPPDVPAPDDPAAAKPKDPDVDPADEMHSRDGILFVPVADHVRRRLAGLSPEARAVYRSTYEAPAREALQRARSLSPARAPAELRRIAERYPLTLAGSEAWAALSERLLGAGRPAEAVRALEARLELPGDAPADRATALARLAVAALVARQPEAARRALDRVLAEHPDAAIQVRGESVPGRDLAVHPLFRGLLAAERHAAPGEPPAWVSEGGAFDHASYPARADSLPPLGSRARWTYPAAGAGGDGSPSHGPVTRGVSHGGAVYARVGDEVVAIDAQSGKRIWAAAPGTPEQPAAAHGRVRVLHSRQGQVLPSDLSLAIVPARGPGERAMLLGIDALPRMNQTADGRMVFGSNRLVAFDAISGKLRWSLEGEPQVEGEESPEDALAFAAPPVVAAGLLVAPALKGDSLHAIGISTNGKVLWARRLYAYNQALVMRYGHEASAGSSFAAREGLVAAASGHGMVCVLDAASGDVLWASRYRSEGRVSGHFAIFDSTRSRPPVIAGSLLVSFPPDGDHVTAFDLRSGAVRWERRVVPSQGQFLLGADTDRVYVAGETLLALRIADGADDWESEAVGPPGIASGIVVEGRILVAAGASRLLSIDSETGKVASGIRVLDPRITSAGWMGLFLAPGQVLAAAGRIVAFEPQDASWRAVGEEADRRLHERAQLLRAEGRHAEAIAALDRRRARVRSEDLRESIGKEIVLVARAAAEATGKASFITEVLARADPIVKERREEVALRLLEASLLEKEAESDGAARIYGDLLRLDGFLATSPDGFEVDARTYAAEALGMLRAAGVDASDPAGEARAREVLAGAPSAAALSRIVLRRPHLDAAREAGLRLAADAERDGDSWRAAGIRALAGLAADSVRAPHDSARGGEPTPGLAEVLAAAGGKPLGKSFWISSEEGFLAATSPGSLPLPALLAIAKTSARLYGPDGKLLLERPLPDYPDVSELKISLQSHLEEPAIASAHADHVLLFTAAGFYDLGGIGGASAAVQPRDIKLRWTSPWRHPFAEISPNPHRWGSIGLSQGENSFPELGEAPDGSPIVLFRDGTIVAFDARSGKRTWRSMSEAYGAASPPVVQGASIVVAAARPPGLALHRPGARAKGGGRAAGRLVPGPAPTRGLAGAALAAGGLAAAFWGEGLDVIEVETGRLLWRRPAGPAAIVHATGSELWLSEPGKLVRRSIRSGRERSWVPLPEHASVVDVLERGGETILIVSRGASARVRYSGYYSQTQTGTDLHVIWLDAGGKKAREAEVHKGPVTYDGGRMNAPGGGMVLFFNGATEPEKWYTRAVLVEPGGEVKDLLTAEIQGKGTGQPPRLAVLRGGLGVGNSGGFGWYAPGGSGPPDGGVGRPPPDEAGASAKEPEGR
jgi:outer membrane protein assembly factor BamB